MNYDPGRSSDLQIIPQPRLPITTTVALCGSGPCLQRWPNVTDLHRIPFSPPVRRPAAPGSSLVKTKRITETAQESKSKKSDCERSGSYLPSERHLLPGGMLRQSVLTAAASSSASAAAAISSTTLSAAALPSAAATGPSAAAGPSATSAAAGFIRPGPGLAYGEFSSLQFLFS